MCKVVLDKPLFCEDMLDKVGEVSRVCVRVPI